MTPDNQTKKGRFSVICGVLAALSMLVLFGMAFLKEYIAVCYYDYKYGWDNYNRVPFRLCICAAVCAAWLVVLHFLPVRRLLRASLPLYGVIIVLSVILLMITKEYSHRFSQFLFLGDFTFYLPTLMLGSVFCHAYFAARYRFPDMTYYTVWIVIGAVIPVILLMAFPFKGMIPFYLAAFTLFSVLLVRDGRIKGNRLLLPVGVCLLAVALLCYGYGATGLKEFFSVLWTRGQNAPLEEGFFRVTIDQVLKTSRFIGESWYKVGFADGVRMPAWQYLVSVDNTFMPVAVIGGYGYLAYAGFMLVQLLAPAALLIASRKAANSYARFFALFLSLLFFCQVAFNQLSCFLLGLSVPLPFTGQYTEYTVQAMLMLTAFVLCGRREAAPEQTDEDYPSGEMPLKQKLLRFSDAVLPLPGFLRKAEKEVVRDRVYVSFAKEDERYARMLIDYLEQNGLTCISSADGPEGLPDDPRRNDLQDCDSFIPLITDAYLRDENTTADLFCSYAEQLFGMHVYPVKLDGAALGEEGSAEGCSKKWPADYGRIILDCILAHREIGF